LAVSAVVLSAGVALGAAQYQSRNIVAFFGDLRLVINGTEVDTETVEPFRLEDGTIMVPARPLAQALGLAETWEEASHTLYLGSVPAEGGGGEGQSPPPPAAPPQPATVLVQDLPALRNVGPFYQQKDPLLIAGRAFNKGLLAEIDQNDERQSEEDVFSGAETVIDLKGRFTTLEGYIGVEDETQNSTGGYVLTITGDNRQLYQSHVVKPSDYPRLIRVNITGVKRLILHIDWVHSGTGDYDRLIAALANLQVK